MQAAGDAPDLRPKASRWLERWSARSGGASYWLTRFFLLRLLGFIYLIAFLAAADQLVPLIGEGGLTPVDHYLADARAAGYSFGDAPSLFWWGSSDLALRLVSLVGAALALAVVCGVTNGAVMAALWFLYMSIVNVGQVWYGYGWELLLLEAGFLAIFLCPLTRLRPLPARSPPPLVVIWLYRWLIFRVMFGAGLIKLRGDDCWTELTCLETHYETQPLPNPLSWYLHQMPAWFHAAGAVWNHIVELVVPFLVFGPRRVRHAAGVILISFQLLLIASGNLSFLNWLTIAICVACFDDRALFWIFPDRLRRRIAALSTRRPTAVQRLVPAALAAVIAILSIEPALNLLSDDQKMNASYDRLSLVNTYGAFGSVGEERYELVIEGTADADPDGATWRAYELPCKPGRTDRRPCVVSPYHYRLDWQLWFAAPAPLARNPWLAHLVYQLLTGDPDVTSLFAVDPFPDRPPRYVRVVRYRYRFTRPGEDGWWRRDRLGAMIDPVSADDPRLVDYLRGKRFLR